MPKILGAALLVAVALTACGSYNGGSSPAGGAPTTTPRQSDAAKTPTPSSAPSADPYYGY